MTDYQAITNSPDPAPTPSRRLAVLRGTTLAAAVALGAVAAPLVGVTAQEPTAGPVTTPRAAALGTRAEFDASDLADVTLGELHKALEGLGLKFSIERDDDGSFDDDSFDDDSFDDSFDDWDTPEGTFAVDGDRIDLSGSASEELKAEAQRVWGRFVALIPADQRQMVSAFELDDSEDAGGYVYPDETDPTKWILGMAPSGLSDEDVDYVLIHEFGHLLTLQASEVPPTTNDQADTCPTYFTGEGCALSGSLMNDFVQQFWPAEQRELIEQLTYDEDWDGLDRFYEEHQSDFVTDYATTNPAEDLAETFAHFVLEDRPVGNTIADQKVQMLWDDPALADLRDDIRSRL